MPNKWQKHGKPKSGNTPRQDNPTSPPNQKATSDKHDAAGGEKSLPAQIPPTPRFADKTDKKWYQTLQGWKALLEVIAIPFAIAYAVVTIFQWRDTHYGYLAEYRPFIRLNKQKPAMLVATQLPPRDNATPTFIGVEFENTGKGAAQYLRFESSAVLAGSSVDIPAFELNDWTSRKNQSVVTEGAPYGEIVKVSDVVIQELIRTAGMIAGRISYSDLNDVTTLPWYEKRPSNRYCESVCIGYTATPTPTFKIVSCSANLCDGQSHHVGVAPVGASHQNHSKQSHSLNVGLLRHL